MFEFTEFVSVNELKKLNELRRDLGWFGKMKKMFRQIRTFLF